MGSLERYRGKRNFDVTPEPRGRVRRSGRALRFVVQQHAASPLHFDFRLEMEGMLKSWALPREPVAQPGEKRLAMHTEDHPVEYVDFAGGIPGGEYGGGHLDVWDAGTWIPEEPPTAAYRRGSLSFTLKGKRLRGRWSLVRIGNAQTRKKDLWLLLKRSDEAREAAPARTAARRRAAKTGPEARR